MFKVVFLFSFLPLTVWLVDSFQYLLSGLRQPWLEPVAEHLPDGDTERPHVRRGGELEEVDAFGRAPSDGELQVHVEVGLVVVFADAEGSV